MLGSLFSHGSQAFAIHGDKGLFLRAGYDARGRAVNVDYALYGTFDENLRRDVVDDVPVSYRNRPVWVSVFVENIGQQNDIRVVGVDAGGDEPSLAKVASLADTQLQAVEADDRVEYVHTVAMRRGPGGTDWIGGSMPASIMRRTFDYWRKQRKGRGFRRPRIGSRHIAIANLYLALHPEAPARNDGYTLLAHWSRDVDFFCLMKGPAFVDCGSTSVDASATFDDHMDHLSSWARAFVDRRGISEAEGLRACVVCPEKASLPSDYEIDPSKLEFWEVPWDRIRCASSTVECEMLKDPELAVSALGLALHGI
ncbi:MAG: hypothetical protein IJQ73_08140 [Kiritimatiellae bacterium]|nr:hypothetical protein [Kiritimatiellia bacterium]